MPRITAGKQNHKLGAHPPPVLQRRNKKPSGECPYFTDEEVETEEGWVFSKPFSEKLSCPSTVLGIYSSLHRTGPFYCPQPQNLQNTCLGHSILHSRSCHCRARCNFTLTQYRGPERENNLPYHPANQELTPKAISLGRPLG